MNSEVRTPLRFGNLDFNHHKLSVPHRKLFQEDTDPNDDDKTCVDILSESSKNSFVGEKKQDYSTPIPNHAGGNLVGCLQQCSISLIQNSSVLNDKTLEVSENTLKANTSDSTMEITDNTLKTATPIINRSPLIGNRPIKISVTPDTINKHSQSCENNIKTEDICQDIAQSPTNPTLQSPKEVKEDLLIPFDRHHEPIEKWSQAEIESPNKSTQGQKSAIELSDIQCKTEIPDSPREEKKTMKRVVEAWKKKPFEVSHTKKKLTVPVGPKLLTAERARLRQMIEDLRKQNQAAREFFEKQNKKSSKRAAASSNMSKK